MKGHDLPSAPVNDAVHLIGRAIEAAFAAGERIRAVEARSTTVEWKADRSPLTEADRGAHAAIIEVLHATGLPVLSEEGAEVAIEERQAWPWYWLVDPLDGTKEFIKGNGEYTVNIALMERDPARLSSLGTADARAGVLYAPVLDRLYFAWPGGGAYRLDRARTFRGGGAYELAAQAQRLPMHRSDKSFTIVASRSHGSPDTEAYIERRRQEHGSVQLVSMGSALKICLVAEGSADAYPRYAPTMEWDTAAGQAIVQEAGRELRDVTTGERMRYNKQELVNQWFIVE